MTDNSSAPGPRGPVPPVPSPDLSRETRWRLALAVVAGIPPLLLLLAEWILFGGDWTFPLDDSYIHLVFARSLAQGEGLMFNPGELVAGTTAPLWTALLGLLALLPGSIVVWTKLAGCGLQVGVVLATFGLARRLELAPARAAVAALLVAVTDWLVWSAPSGMEVPLFTALSLAGISRHIAERAEPRLPPVALLWLALAALARPEGLLLLPLALADRALRLRALDGGLKIEPLVARDGWSLARGIVLAALVLLPVALVFREISGSIFPTTLLAKSSGPPILVPQMKFLRAVLGLLWSSHPWMTLLALGGVVESVRRLGGGRDRGLLLALWFFALPVGSAMLSSGNEIAVGNFGRYFFPLLPVVVLLGVLALDRLSFSRFRRAGALPIGALALVALFLPSLLGLVRAGGLYVTACQNVRASDIAAARWLASRLDPRAVLAVNDIGAFRYLLPNPVLDLVGIVDPAIAERRRRGALGRENYQAVLQEIVEERRPDFLAVFPSWFPQPARSPERYPPLLSIAIPDNVAMAGDMMAVYATPWTRWPLEPVSGSASGPGTEGAAQPAVSPPAEPKTEQP